MTFRSAERVRETSTTTGTGTYTLGGAPTGYQAVSAIGANNYGPFFATDGTNWEAIIGRYLSGPDRLERTHIKASSNGGAAVNWGTGTRTIRSGWPAWLALPVRQSIDVAGGVGTTTLSQLQQRCHILEFTGALTGNRTIEVDETAWLWQVVNLTTGDFTVTFRVTGQTGTKIQRTRRTVAYCDGTDIRLAENTVQRNAADIVAAASLDLNVDGDAADITGNTGITAITLEEGREVTTRFTGTPTITDGASLILPERQSLTMRAGDFVRWRGYAGGVVRALLVQRADAAAPLPRSYLAGFTLANNAVDATNDIDIAAGACRNSANTANIIGAAMTKQLDAAWAAGTGAGMRATGVAIADGTYHIFSIRRPDTGQVDYAADTSATGANIAANTNVNYTDIRRIGSILRESGTIIPFKQDGDQFIRANGFLDINLSNPGTAGISATLSVPNGVRVRAIINYNFSFGATGDLGLISSLDQTDNSPTNAACEASGGFVNNTDKRTWQYVQTNASRQIRYRVNGSAADVGVRIRTIVWVDSRGRDD